MRTTVSLDQDVAKAIADLRREQGLGLSAAVNELVRRGLSLGGHGAVQPFRQTASPMGAPRVPLDDIGSALELLEGESHR
mgnify:FL=1